MCAIFSYPVSVPLRIAVLINQVTAFAQKLLFYRFSYAIQFVQRITHPLSLKLPKTIYGRKSNQNFLNEHDFTKRYHS